jgi:hypothetical protein
MDIETFKFPIYICVCGYKTIDCENANNHNKDLCIHKIKLENKEFVLKESHIAALSKTTSNGDIIVTNSKHVDIDIDKSIGKNIIDNKIDNSTHIININLVLPDNIIDKDLIKYLKTLKHLKFKEPQKNAAMPENQYDYSL